MFNLLIRIFLVGGLIFIWPERVDSNELMALSCMMILVLVSYSSEPFRPIGIMALFVPFLFSVLTLFFSKSVVCMSSVLNVFVALTAIKAIGERYDMNNRTVGIWLAFLFLINAAFLYLQSLGLDKVYAPNFSQFGISGTMELPWALGCAAVLALPFIMEINPFIGLLMMPFLWLSQSSACILAGLVALFVYFIKNKKYLMVTLAASPLILIVYVLKDGFDSNRLHVWKTALAYFKHPIIGSGLGSWAHVPFRHETTAGDPTTFMWWRWAHNEFYQQAFEQGIIGLLMLIFVCFVIFKFAKTQCTRAALTGLYILCVFHPVLHWGKLSFFAILIVGIALAEGYKPSIEAIC